MGACPDFTVFVLRSCAQTWRCTQIAYAHVRGGGELGQGWHAAGRRGRKPNALHDYLACLGALHAAGIAQPGRVAGHAFSAGAFVKVMVCCPVGGALLLLLLLQAVHTSDSVEHGSMRLIGNACKQMKSLSVNEKMRV